MMGKQSVTCELTLFNYVLVSLYCSGFPSHPLYVYVLAIALAEAHCVALTLLLSVCPVLTNAASLICPPGL